jgi:Mn-dependent DtxR family transcriptional regulator
MAEENACRMEHGFNREAVRRLKLFIDMVKHCLSRENSCMEEFQGKVKT